MIMLQSQRREMTRGPRNLTRDQLVEFIQERNPGAKPDFLVGFDRDALATYLEHLLAMEEPRGKRASWVRPGDTAAVRMCIPGDD